MTPSPGGVVRRLAVTNSATPPGRTSPHTPASGGREKRTTPTAGGATNPRRSPTEGNSAKGKLAAARPPVTRVVNRTMDKRSSPQTAPPTIDAGTSRRTRRAASEPPEAAGVLTRARALQMKKGSPGSTTTNKGRSSPGTAAATTTWAEVVAGGNRTTGRRTTTTTAPTTSVRRPRVRASSLPPEPVAPPNRTAAGRAPTTTIMGVPPTTSPPPMPVVSMCTTSTVTTMAYGAPIMSTRSPEGARPMSPTLPPIVEETPRGSVRGETPRGEVEPNLGGLTSGDHGASISDNEGPWCVVQGGRSRRRPILGRTPPASPELASPTMALPVPSAPPSPARGAGPPQPSTRGVMGRPRSSPVELEAAGGTTSDHTGGTPVSTDTCLQSHCVGLGVRAPRRVDLAGRGRARRDIRVAANEGECGLHTPVGRARPTVARPLHPRAGGQRVPRDPAPGNGGLGKRDELAELTHAVVTEADLDSVASRVTEYFQGAKTTGLGSRPPGGRGNDGSGPGAGRRGGRPGVRPGVSRGGGNPSREGDRNGAPNPGGREFEVREATRIQRLFRQNRPRAVREVLHGSSEHCQVDRAEVQRYFEGLHGGGAAGESREQPGWVEAPLDEASTAALVAPLSEAEVDRRLGRMKNSAPGPDGLTYSDLRRADPGSRLLTAVFNCCLALERVPSSWKTSNTVLIHKKGDREDLSNWRPLAMGDTMAKLLAALIADRLTDWAVKNGRISPTQKGFLPYEGCYEHNFVLQEVLSDAKKRRRGAVVVWLDLSNAFGSVPHATIRDALTRANVPSSLLNIWESMYDGCTTRVRTAQGYTDPIRILSGVRQGCPLSPIVFNLALEPVLRSAAGAEVGYSLYGRQHSVLAYADDLALIASSPEEMRDLLARAVDAATSIGLRFNPAKCASLCLAGGRVGGVRLEEFAIQGETIRSLGVGESYEHLGIPTGCGVRQTPFVTLEAMIADLRAVDASRLAPWQRVETVATFILPRLDFLLRGAHVEKRPLKEADNLVKKFTKAWLNLPQRASAEVVFIPPKKGGCGLLPLADLADALTVAHAFRLLAADDAMVRELAWESLRDAVRRKICRLPSNQDLADYLSGSLEGAFAKDGGYASMWSRARTAARRQSARLGLRWRWSGERQELAIECRGAGGRTVTVPPAAKSQVIGRLRAAVSEYYYSTLVRKPDQGKVFEVSSRMPVSNHFMRGGNFTRFADWRFLHRARLDVLPLNGARRWGDGDRRCRRCGEGLESLPHVLCHCGVHSAAIQARHNAVLDRLRRACRLPGNVRIDQIVEGVDSDLGALRPDLVVRHEASRSIVIVDVTVPFENRRLAFDEARARKIAKYAPLAQSLVGLGYRVAVDALVVGALGSWDPRNEAVLKTLRISERYASLMRRLIVSETIKWSRDIYVEHVSGIRQYPDASSAEGPAGPVNLPLAAEAGDLDSNVNSNEVASPNLI